jgi:hypothetical protein
MIAYSGFNFADLRGFIKLISYSFATCIVRPRILYFTRNCVTPVTPSASFLSPRPTGSKKFYFSIYRVQYIQNQIILYISHVPSQNVISGSSLPCQNLEVIDEILEYQEIQTIFILYVLI